MALIREYHCPTSLDAAVALLARPERGLAALGGGSTLVGELETGARTDLDGVVDLRKLGLNTIRRAGDHLLIGATATLTDVSRDPVAGTLAGGILRRTARGEGPLNLRNLATVGGIVATAAADSEFHAALLALETTVQIHGLAGPRLVPLSELTGVDGLITALRIPIRAGTCGHARVARTPSDRPIVAAIYVSTDESSRTALCGLASRPVLAGAPLDPPDDFKGSAEYRRAMAPIVAARAAAEAGR